jgi:hypothetical protein
MLKNVINLVGKLSLVSLIGYVKLSRPMYIGSLA